VARGRFAEAIPQFERALGNPLYRDRMIAETNLGWALYKTGAAEKGMRRIESALAISPKYCLGWRQLGTIHAERGELQAAADAFAKYAGSCPDTADAHLQSGKILARQTRASDARVAFQRCAGSKDERELTVARECQRLLRELTP
jgi:Tfp pilus assembly protein PilF